MIQSASYCGLPALRCETCAAFLDCSFSFSHSFSVLNSTAFTGHRNAAILLRLLGGWAPKAGFLPIHCPQLSLPSCSESGYLALPSEAWGHLQAHSETEAPASLCPIILEILTPRVGQEAGLFKVPTSVTTLSPTLVQLFHIFSIQTKALVSKTFCHQ